MPLSALTVDNVQRASTIGNNTSRGSANRTVSYRLADGRTRNAVVLSKGGTSGLKLKIPGTVAPVDNVAALTTVKGVSGYHNRL